MLDTTRDPEPLGASTVLALCSLAALVASYLWVTFAVVRILRLQLPAVLRVLPGF